MSDTRAQIEAGARILCAADRQRREEPCCGPAGMICSGGRCEDGWERFSDLAEQVLAHAWLETPSPTAYEDVSYEALQDLASMDTFFYVTTREKAVFAKIRAALKAANQLRGVYDEPDPDRAP